MTEPSDRLFLDTSYVIARFNRRDQHHVQAKRLAEFIAQGRELFTTDAILLEIAAAFSQPKYRTIAISIWDEFHSGNPRYRSFEATGPRLQQAVDLFRNRTDKAWSLADCLSFVVMNEQQLHDALTTDRHFLQAGFRALLAEE
jgi:uncharacterized protein